MYCQLQTKKPTKAKGKAPASNSDEESDAMVHLSLHSAPTSALFYRSVNCLLFLLPVRHLQENSDDPSSESDVRQAVKHKVRIHLFIQR
jgi:hypothetical protein